MGGEILAKSKLEQAAHRRRLDRSVKDSRRLVRGFGLAAGPEGHALVNRHLGRLVDFMREVLRDPPTSRQGRKMPSLTVEVHALIKDVPVEALALAALAGTMNATRAAPAKGGEEGHSPGRVAVEIVGAEIERAARAHYLKTEHPHLLKRIDCATAHKARLKARLALERKILADRGVRFDWKRFDRLHVGAWGIACCFEALPDVFVLEQNVPAIAESAWNVAEAVATQQMLRHCPQTPLLVPPKPWTWSRNDDGLDFLKGCRDQEAVQRAIVSGTLRPHMDAINYLQSTAFKIDPDVLSLVRNHSLWLNPPLLGVSRTHRKDRGPRQVLEWDIKEAEILASEPFYVQLRCEWRGRMLPISDLHYARDDYLRAMFRFAQGAPIGERGIYWLKVSTANCFGGAIARAPFDERVKWVDEKMDTLRRLVADPPSGLKFVTEEQPFCGAEPFWKRAKDPYQFYSHAKELVDCDNNPNFITTLPLPLDASNSGAQHYSLLARDPDGARLTNLIDEGKPNDLYGEIACRGENRLTDIIERSHAEDALARCAMWWRARDYTSRENIKSIVVTYMYGQDSAHQQGGVLKDLSESERIPEVLGVDYGPGEDDRFATEVYLHKPPEGYFPPGYIKWFVNLVRKEIETAFPAVVEIRRFLREIAAALAAHGQVLKWTSPSGVPIKNEYFKAQEADRMRLYLGARPFRPLVAPGRTDELDTSKCKLAASPNVIHSLEASHMAFVALACEAARIPLFTVHDCFFVLGCHIDELREIWLRELREMYFNENLLRDIYKYARRVLGPHALLPDIPKHRGLDLSSVTGPYALG